METEERDKESKDKIEEEEEEPDQEGRDTEEGTNEEEGRRNQEGGSTKEEGEPKTGDSSLDDAIIQDENKGEKESPRVEGWYKIPARRGRR